MTGQVVGGRYTLGRLIGRGGSGAVFEARDQRLGCMVAVKVLHEHLAGRPGAVADLLAEARAAAGLSHPNLVRVLDAGHDDNGSAWVAAELVDGITLGELVERVGPLTATNALRVAEGVLAGLAHAHARGLLHLDVSPSNVMVAFGPSGFDLRRPQLLDLGRRPPSVLPGQLVRVTPHYASPELATAGPTDARADLYAVGAVLFFLLTGRPPFERASHQAVLEAHVHTRPPAPSAISPSVPHAVDQLVATALAKDPAHRYPSATAMSAAVVRASAGIEAQVPRRTRFAEPFELASNRGGLVAAVTAVLVVGGLAAGAVAQSGNEPDRERASLSIAEPEALSTPRPMVEPAAELGPVEVPVAHAAVEPVRATVPALERLSLLEVADVLALAGLVIGDVASADSGYPAGTVLSSAPVAGESVPVNSAVAVVIASGTSIVPDVVGLDPGPAREALEAAGFVVRGLEGQGSRPRTALRTEPRAGMPARVGNIVDVELSGASAAPTAPSAPSATSAPSASPTPVLTPTPSASPTTGDLSES